MGAVVFRGALASGLLSTRPARRFQTSLWFSAGRNDLETRVGMVSSLRTRAEDSGGVTPLGAGGPVVERGFGGQGRLYPRRGARAGSEVGFAHGTPQETTPARGLASDWQTPAGQL